MAVIEAQGDIPFATDGVLREHLKHILNHHERWQSIIGKGPLLDRARAEFPPNQVFDGRDFGRRVELQANGHLVAERYRQYLSDRIAKACNMQLDHVHHSDGPYQQVIIVWKRKTLVWIVAKTAVRKGYPQQYVITSGYRLLADSGARLMTKQEVEAKILDYVFHLEVNLELLALHDPIVAAQRYHKGS